MVIVNQVGNSCPIDVGGGDEGDRCINANTKFGEKILAGNKNRFPLRFRFSGFGAHLVILEISGAFWSF